MSFCPIFFFLEKRICIHVYDQSKQEWPFIGIGWTFEDKIKSHTFGAPFIDQQFTHYWLTCTQCRLKAWACWADALGPLEHRGPILISVCCVQHVFFHMFKHWFCWKYQYNKYMFNFIDHLHFYFCEWLC